MLEGKRISGRYKVLEIIGGGGMSNVYLAHDMILNRDVAMKVLRYDFKNEAELHRRFHREALSATSLTHPNIVNIYDVGDDDGIHYIVMEYIKGKTLKQYIQEYSPLSPAKSVHIMKQLTSAIANAHENGIVHRDIKPQNILVDENGDVKITDFGIAMTLSATSFTQTNSVLGTVHYLSPEQARGGTATKKSDIYALGIVLYELLTGELPFSGESAVSIALKHLQTDTPSVRKFDASIPQSLENMVLKATAKDPLQRYQSVEEMQADLETVLSPGRLNESKFLVSVDDEMTKAIPVIKDPKKPLSNMTKPEPAREKSEKKPVGQVEKKPTKKMKKKWPKIAAAIIGVVLLLLILLFTTDLFSPRKIEIPDLKNYSVEDGTKKLEELGFIVSSEIREIHDDEVEEGYIVETDPEEGKTRIKGSEITLYVSLGAETYEMANYMGESLDQVQKIIDESDFAEVKINREYSNESTGTIIGQEPAAGEEIIIEETTLVLTVSAGKNLLNVGNLKGYNKSNLSDYEKSSGLKVRILREEFNNDVAADFVISQSPQAGEKLEEGGTIDVVISKGPQEKNKKLYTTSVLIPYAPEEEGKPQKVRIFYQDKTNTIAKPYEQFEIHEDTNYQIRLEIVEGEKAEYHIERDSTVIIKKTIPYNFEQSTP